jgi:primosomal protein N'
VRVLVTGASSEGPVRALAELKAQLPVDALGPARLPRLRGRHRAQLIAKTDAPRHVAGAAGRWLAAAAAPMRRRGLTAVVDVDPQSF